MLKHNVRWQYISQMKKGLGPGKKIFLSIKMLQADFLLFTRSLRLSAEVVSHVIVVHLRRSLLCINQHFFILFA